MVSTNNCNLGFQTETFNPETCTWNTFVKRLKNKFILYDTPPAKQGFALLDSISADVLEQLCGLCQPQEPETMTFDELVDFLQILFQSVPSKFVERCKFHNRVQQENETFRDFANDLVKYALRCKFPSNWFHESLVTQFIVGIKSEQLRSKLCKTKFDVFEDLIEFASKFELTFHRDYQVPSTATNETASEIARSKICEDNNEDMQVVTNNDGGEEVHPANSCVPPESQLRQDNENETVGILLPELRLDQYHIQLFESDFAYMNQQNEENTNNVNPPNNPCSDVDSIETYASVKTATDAIAEKPEVFDSLEPTKKIVKSKSKKKKTSKKKTEAKTSGSDTCDSLKKPSILRSPKLKLVSMHFENVSEESNLSVVLPPNSKRTKVNCQAPENAEVCGQKRRKVADRILRHEQNEDSNMTSNVKREIKEPASTDGEMPTETEEEKSVSTESAKRKHRRAKDTEAALTRKSNRDRSKVKTLNPTCLENNDEIVEVDQTVLNDESSEIEAITECASESNVTESVIKDSQPTETSSSNEFELSIPYVTQENEKTSLTDFMTLRKRNTSAVPPTANRSNADENHIWQGLLKWLDKMGSETVASRQIRCTITIEAKENASKLSLSTWPKILRMELKPATQSIPLDGSHRIDETFKATIVPEKNRSLNPLINSMKTGLVACVEVQLSPNKKIIIVVHYFRNQETFVGYINICIRQPEENVKQTPSLTETESNEVDTTDANTDDEILSSEKLKKRRQREEKAPERKIVDHMERRKRRLNLSWLSNGLRSDFVFNI